MMDHRFAIGDVIRCTVSGQEMAEPREIVSLQPRGMFEWKYSFSDEVFFSGNSTDPQMTYWEKVDPQTDDKEKA